MLENELYHRACRLLDGLVILDDQPHKAPDALASGKVREAVELFQQVIQLNPASWQSMLLAGKAFQSLGELDQALVWFLRAHDCVPTDPVIAKEVGFAAGKLGRHEVAVRVMQAVSSAHPEDPALCINLGLSQLMSGRPAEASEAFARATELEPQRDMNRRLRDLAREVAAGKLACPKNEKELSAAIRVFGKTI